MVKSMQSLKKKVNIMPKFDNKEWLMEKYFSSSMSAIAKEYSVSPMLVMDWLNSHNIPVLVRRAY